MYVLRKINFINFNAGKTECERNIEKNQLKQNGEITLLLDQNLH